MASEKTRAVRKELAHLLAGFVETIETLKSHSENSPKADAALGDAYDRLRNASARVGSILFGQQDGKLILQRKLLEVEEPALKNLIQILRDRKLQYVRFSRQVTRSDFKRLLRILVRSPSDSLVRGAIRPVLLDEFNTIRLSTEAEEVSHKTQARRKDYFRGRALEKTLGLTPVKELAAGEGVEGVARLITLEQGAPEEVLTLVRKAGLLEVEWVVAESPLRGLLILEGSTVESKPRRVEARFEDADLPPGALDWDSFLTTAEEAGDCQPKDPVLGGVRYRHILGDREDVQDVLWANPNEREHTYQVRLVASYRALREAIGPADPGPVAGGDVDRADAPIFSTLEEAEAYCAEHWNGLGLGRILRCPLLAYLDPDDDATLEDEASTLEALGSNLDEAIATQIRTLLQLARQLSGRGAG